MVNTPIPTTGSFDSKTAHYISRRAGGSPHPMFVDGEGNACLLVISQLSGGGFAISVDGLKALRAHPGGQFIRLKRPGGWVDKLLSAEDVPLGRLRHGERGDYYVVEAEDLRDPEWPPFSEGGTGGEGGNGGGGEEVPF